MSQTVRATVYLDGKLHRALRLKAAETDSNVSTLINEAVRHAFAEDLEDLKIIRERVAEPTRSFEAFLTELADDNLI